ncbi:MAG: hypothetical protein SFU86_18195 [Pirellulaceae bacterium]|nr:hypothetical protein [Pirellulaceae bacterium]
MTRSRRGLVTMALVFCSLHAGCSLLQPQEAPKLTADVAAAAGQVATPGGTNTYTIEIRKADGRTAVKQQELTGPLHVQEALAGSKANKQFRRFTLALQRPLPDGRVHNMDVEFDRAAKMVEPEYDYTLLPGDKLIVTEDTTSMVDEALDMVSGSMGGINPLTGKPKVKNTGKYRIGG